MHEAMAATLDRAVEEIKRIQLEARDHGKTERPRWPMIVLNSPKGWTGPKVIDGLQVEGTFRSHQVPLSDPRTNPKHLKQLEEWMRSYRAEELFDEKGHLRPELAELAPAGTQADGLQSASERGHSSSRLEDARFSGVRSGRARAGSAGHRRYARAGAVSARCD